MTKYIHQISIYCILISVLFASCDKTALTEDPYANGKQPLAFTFVSKNLDQQTVSSGEVVSLKVKGLNKYLSDLKVFVNEAEAELIRDQVNDSTLVFKVPVNASTGSMWITTAGQTFFGPLVRIGGKLTSDNTWKVVNGTESSSGANPTIYDIELLPSGRYFIGGSFNRFENSGTAAVPIGGIAQIDADGGYATTNINFGKGVGGGASLVNSVARISVGAQAGKFILAGDFASFNSTRANRQNLSNMVRLNVDASSTLPANMDSLIVNGIFNPKPEETNKNSDTVSTFNGGTDGTIKKALVLDEKIYVIGDFLNYRRMFLRASSYDEKVYDLTRMRQIVRMDVNGAMDSTYRYNPATKQSPFGANGIINDAFVQTDGSLILVGAFTTFDGVAANRIVRLKPDGTVDNTFSVGTAADNDIVSIRWNANTRQFVITGLFTSFNGKNVNGVNLLSANGANVTTFNPQQISGGAVTFAGQLNNGKIIVAGSFNRIGTFLRQGFMVLENTGALAEGYNNTGGFQGRIYDMVETPTSTGSRVILVGRILRFNAGLPKNLMRLNFAN